MSISKKQKAQKEWLESGNLPVVREGVSLEKYHAGLDMREIADLQKCEILEEVCFAALRGEEPKYISELVPANFKDVVVGLKLVWDARDRILKRGRSAGSGDVNVQVNLVEMLKKASEEPRILDLI